MAETRALVPTERQAALGDRPPGAVAPPPAGVDAGRATGAPSEQQRERKGRLNAVRQTLRDADPRRIPGPRAPLYVFGLVGLITQWDDAALGALLPEIRAELGLSTQVLATISSAVSITALALAIPFGYLADRVRRVMLLRLGIIGTNLSSVVQATTPGLSQLLAGRLLGGVGYALQQPAGFSYLADSYPSTSRTRVFGFMYLVGQLGLIVGPLVAGVVGELFGWRAALGGLGALATAVGLLTFLLREPVRGGYDRLEASGDPELAAQEQPPLGFAAAMRAAWSIRTVRRLVIATPFLFLKGAASLTLLSLYFSEVFVMGPGQRGAIVSAAAVLGMLGLVFAAPLGDRLLAERPGAFMPLAAAGTAVQAAGFVILGLTGNVAVAILVFVPISAVDIVLAPAFFSLLSQVVPARVRGLGLQILAPAQLLGLLAFPFLAGIADEAGLQRGVAVFAVPTALGALVLAGGGPGTVRDRRTALAAGLAEEYARQAMAEGLAPTLVVRDLEAGYGAAPVLLSVDLEVAPGELLAVLGPNGAGKTTLLRTIAAAHPSTSGVVSIAGVDASSSTAHELARNGVSLVPGGQAVIAGLTVEEHLRAAASAAAHTDEAGAGEDPVDIDAAVDAALARFPALAGRRSQPAQTLSGGEQQLLALACADLARPLLLLVDELSLGLAPSATRRALAAARGAADAGAAVVVVEQSVDAVLDVADRVLVLEKGEVVFSGSADQLRDRPGTLAAVALGGGERTARHSRRRPADPGAEPPALVAQGVSVSFGGVQAVSDASVEAAAGEVVGIIGPNGAGKTTLFDVISGFVAPDSGRLLLGGTDITPLVPHERARLGLGRTFQRARLFPGLSVRDAVLAALDRRAGPGASLAPLGLPSGRRAEQRLRRRAEGTLEVLDLDRWADVLVGDLPTGTRRLVSLACTLAFEPSVVLLDEPTAGLSRLEAEDVPPLLRRTASATGAALLVIEHDVPLLATAADRFIAMVGGRVVAEGLPDAVVQHPTVVAAYLGHGDDDVSDRTTTTAGAEPAGKD